MNAEAARYDTACNEEDARIGSVAAARLHALQKLRLKTAVKVRQPGMIQGPKLQ